MIIAGERRWRASNLAGLTEVPCIEFDIDEKTIAEIALIENLQRKDLTVWEEADGLAYLSDKFGYTHEEIAKKIGKSRTTVTESMAIAGLPEPIRAKCHKAEITAKSTLLEIARQFDEQAMHDFLDNIGKNNLKRDEIRRAARPDKKPKAIAASTQNLSSVRNSDAQDQDDQPVGNAFRYVSEGNEFTLEIRFNRSDRYDKREVLRALKEAFDRTKSQS